MNNWADDQNRNNWLPVPPGPPKIEVRDTSIYRNGWKVGNLVPTDPANSPEFKEVRAALEEHFKDTVRNPRDDPAPRPSAIPDVPDHTVVNLCPSPLPDDPDLWPVANDPDIDRDDLTALDFALDFTFPDTAQRRWERCEYLNRLLSRKLDLDFDIAWAEFKAKSNSFICPPSRYYKDSLFERLQKACSDYYDRYCLEAEYLVHNEHEPIELDINIDWSTTIFHQKTFDWWFDLRTQV